MAHGPTPAEAGGSGRRGRTPPGNGSRVRPARARWKRLLHGLATSPRTKLVAGIFLLVTALANLTEGVLFDLGEALDPSHALLVLGVLMVIQSVAETFEAVEFFDEATDER